MTPGPSGVAAFKSNMVLWRILLHGLWNAATRHALSPRLQMRVKTLSCERKAREKSTTCRDAVSFSANQRWSRMSSSSTSPHFRAVWKLSSCVCTLVHRVDNLVHPWIKTCFWTLGCPDGHGMSALNRLQRSSLHIRPVLLGVFPSGCSV